MAIHEAMEQQTISVAKAGKRKRNSSHIVPRCALHLTNASLPSGSWSRGHIDVDVLMHAVQCAAALCRAPLSRLCATSACGRLLVSE